MPTPVGPRRTSDAAPPTPPWHWVSVRVLALVAAAGAAACTSSTGTPCVAEPCNQSCVDLGWVGGRCEGGECRCTNSGFRCGDGNLDLGEECDDGVYNHDYLADRCRTDCTLPRCGDTVVDTGEACDDGNTADGDSCRPNCTLPGCGDGVVQAGEECDDGNADETDACLSTCRNASCGDGAVWAGHELCEGGETQACTTTCGTTCARPCSACTWSSTCEPPPEACNGADDDCNGLTDEGPVCPGADADADADTDDGTDADAASGTWPDPTSGLLWENPASGSGRDWADAVAYCDGLSLGGHTDWQLPTISELRSLIRGCAATETGGTCGVTDTCLDRGCLSVSCDGCVVLGGPEAGTYWPPGVRGSVGTWYWSSSSYGGGVSYAWLVGFHYGRVGYHDKISRDYVRCVRRGP